MTVFYLVLKISAVLAFLLLPLFTGRRKEPDQKGMSRLRVNERGYLEVNQDKHPDHVDHHAD